MIYVVQKDQGQHSKQDFLQKFHTTKQEIQFKMTFLKQKTSNMQYLQLLRGYAIINIHKREHQVCATFYPRSRFKSTLILDVTIKIKKHVPTLAPLFSLLVQHRPTPTQAFTPRAYAEMTSPCKWLPQPVTFWNGTVCYQLKTVLCKLH